MDEQRVEAIQRHAVPGGAVFAQTDAGTFGQVGVEPVDGSPGQHGQVLLKLLGERRGCWGDKSNSHGFSCGCFPEPECCLKKERSPASDNIAMRLRSNWLLAVWFASAPAIVPCA